MRIKPKDIYKEVWECRNFEITNLWQRSVFLGAFMLAIAAGYGTLIHGMLFPENDKVIIYEKQQDGNLYIKYSAELSVSLENSEEKANKITVYQHLAASGVSYLGIIFSMLWVMMAKGSKMWYERYEGGINYFTDGDYFNDLKVEDWKIPYYGNLQKLPSHKINDSIISPLAGYYSVSKVNCIIGIVGIYAWGVLNMLHFGLFLRNMNIIKNPVSIVFFAVAEGLLISASTYFLLYIFCRSGRDSR